MQVRRREIPKDQAEHRWPIVAAVLVAVMLYAFLPASVQVVPRWVMPALAVIWLIPLVVFNPHRLTRESTVSRWFSFALGFVLLAVNQVEIALIVHQLVAGHGNAPIVLLSALQVWLTNVIGFGMVFWELDGGGPIVRRMEHVPDRERDFRFPQEDAGLKNWRPQYFDYAYFALSNMMAFSPTDVMPLRLRAKVLMAIQAFTGFALLALVISRAVNVLP